MPVNEYDPVVLIAEDNEDDMLMLRRAFDQLCFAGSIQFVPDGEQAIAYLAGEGRFAVRSEFPMPDFFLLDLKMPRRNGFDVLEWIQARPELVQLRTIVLTTSDDLREVNRAYRLGAASFLTKPVAFTEFKDTIQALTNFWFSRNRHAPVRRPERSTSVQVLTDAARAHFHVRVVHIQSVFVSLLNSDGTCWQHMVEVFELIGHSRTRNCFAWFGAEGQPIIIAATADLIAPEDAVRSYYARHVR
jgi:CheY-like chemotaxis protein